MSQDLQDEVHKLSVMLSNIKTEELTPHESGLVMQMVTSLIGSLQILNVSGMKKSGSSLTDQEFTVIEELEEIGDYVKERMAALGKAVKDPHIKRKVRSAQETIMWALEKGMESVDTEYNQRHK